MLYWNMLLLLVRYLLYGYIFKITLVRYLLYGYSFTFGNLPALWRYYFTFVRYLWLENIVWIITHTWINTLTWIWRIHGRLQFQKTIDHTCNLCWTMEHYWKKLIYFVIFVAIAIIALAVVRMKDNVPILHRGYIMLL